MCPDPATHMSIATLGHLPVLQETATNQQECTRVPRISRDAASPWKIGPTDLCPSWISQAESCPAGPKRRDAIARYQPPRNQKAKKALFYFPTVGVSSGVFAGSSAFNEPYTLIGLPFVVFTILMRHNPAKLLASSYNALDRWKSAWTHTRRWNTAFLFHTHPSWASAMHARASHCLYLPAHG